MRETPRNAALRKRAARRGLRVRRRGNVYELRNGDGLVISGTYASVAAYIDEDCPRRKPGKPARVRPPAAWIPVIEDYLTTLAAAGQPAGHASIATTERYLAVDDAEVRATMMGAL